jgi:hypothetical protein
MRLQVVSSVVTVLLFISTALYCLSYVWNEFSPETIDEALFEAKVNSSIPVQVPDHKNSTSYKHNSSVETPVPTTEAPVVVGSTSSVQWCTPIQQLWQNAYWGESNRQESIVATLHNVVYQNGLFHFYAASSSDREDIQQNLRSYAIDTNFGPLEQQLQVHFGDDQKFDQGKCSASFKDPVLMHTDWVSGNNYHYHNDNLIPLFLSAVLVPDDHNKVEHVDVNKSHLIRVRDSRDHTRLYEVLENLFQTPMVEKSAVEQDTCFKTVQWGMGTRLYYTKDTPSVYWTASGTMNQFFLNSDMFNHLPNPWQCYNTYAELDQAMPVNTRNDYLIGSLHAFQRYVLHYVYKLPRYVRPWTHLIDQIPQNNFWRTVYPITEDIPLVRAPSNAAPRLIFIQRHGSAGQRFVRNLDATISYFQGRGINASTCCDWGGSRVEDLLWNFHTADIIIGLHGAGLTSATYMSPGGIFSELRTSFGYDNPVFMPIFRLDNHISLRVDVRTFESVCFSCPEFPTSFLEKLTDLILMKWQQLNELSTHKTLPTRPQDQWLDEHTDYIL